MKTKQIILTAILFFIISGVGYIYYADNRGIALLPDEVKVISLEFTNVFLIPLDEGYLLLDNGYEKEYDVFLKKLHEFNIDVSEIRYILITHHHDDHSGFLNFLSEANESIRVILHEKSVPLLAAGVNNTANGGGIVNSRIYALFKLKQLITPSWDFSFPPYIVRDRDIVVSGEFFDLKAETGLDAKIIYTPGHSSDSISMVYRDRYIFCGDLASNFLNRAGSKHLTLFNENIDDVYASWEKVLSMDIEYIIPAHGKPFRAERLRENLYKYSQEDIVVYF